ncbi:MAG: DUF362 domain-containing protein [Candidatus Acidiferrales bacterium]
MGKRLQRINSGMKSKTTPKVAVVRTDNDDLAMALEMARQQIPELFPASLPHQVVIKPNLCDITAWESGVTTDPRWLKVLTRALRSIRPDVQVRVVESDAISAYKTYRSCDETFERLGYISAAREAGVELVNLSRCDTIDIRIDGLPVPVRIPQLFLEELFFISLANMKVHAYTRMTGVLKNSLGLLSDADISGLHPYLSALISGLHRLIPPDLCIIDGRIGLEGQGPIIGYPVRMNTIVMGNDALGVDETSCMLMGIQPKDVAHLRQTATDLGRRLGQSQLVGDARPRTFAFSGEQVHEAVQLKFGSKRFHQRMEAFTSRWIDRALRFKHDPLTFTKGAVSKLARGRRAR